MKEFVFAVAALGALCVAQEAGAVTCARGVYRAGCAGPNGAVVARRPAAVVHRPGVAPVRCANGVYRAGCVGPHGAAVVHKRY
jgi:hypothetical protein